MPGDVAVVTLGGGAAAGFLQDGMGSKLWRGGSPEAKSGSMILVGPGKHAQSVQVKVYRTSLEHFAVVYPQKKICRPLGFVNLRHTVVDRVPAEDEDAVVMETAACGRPCVRQSAVWVPRQYQHLPGLVVRHRECDSPHTLVFLSESPKDLESWVAAFDPASKTSPSAALPLPILEEDDEL